MIPQKKYVLDLMVKSVQRVHERYVLIRLTDEKPLPPMLPGQFVEVRVDGSPSTFLRRAIAGWRQAELRAAAGERILTTHHSPLTPFSGWRRRRGAAAVSGQDAAR